MATIINGDGIVTAEGTSTTQGRLRLGEDTDNGTNYVELQAPASVASNVTFTLPSADGTNGQVLQTNGSGTLSFATPSTGAMVYLASTTASNSATVSITTGITSTYDVYAIQLVNVIPATDGEGLRMRTSTDGGTSYDSGAGNYEWQIAEFGNGATSSSFSGADNKIQLYGQIGSAANELGVCGWVYLWKPSAAQYCMISNDIVLLNASGVYFIVKGFSRRLAAADVDAVQFYMSAGNISSGTFRLYGFANS